jgi:hypothetical protein
MAGTFVASQDRDERRAAAEIVNAGRLNERKRSGHVKWFSR